MNEGGSVTCKFSIGTTAGSGEAGQKRVTVDDVKKIAREVLGDHACHHAYSLSGTYEGEEEDSAKVEDTEIIGPRDIDKCIRFCEDANKFVNRVLTELYQTTVLVDVSVQSNTVGRGSVDWNALLSTESPKVFPRPGAVARYLIPSAFYGSLKQYYEVARKAFVDAWPGIGDTFEGVPVVLFTYPSSAPLVLDGLEANQSLCERLRIWDRQFIQGDQVRGGSDRPPEDLASAEFLRRFQRMSDDPCFFATNVRSFVGGASTKLELARCKYVTGAADCDARYLDVVERSASAPALSYDYWLQRSRNLPDAPFPILGVTIVTVSPRDQVLVSKRSKTVGAYPDAFHIAPGAMVEETKGLQGPSIAATFVRELYEEFFNVDERSEDLEPFPQLLERPPLRSLTGVLRCHALSIDLLRSSAALLCSFRPSWQWWSTYYPQIEMNWEYSGTHPHLKSWTTLLEEISGDPTSFTPEAAAALILCHQLANKGGQV